MQHPVHLGSGRKPNRKMAGSISKGNGRILGMACIRDGLQEVTIGALRSGVKILDRYRYYNVKSEGRRGFYAVHCGSEVTNLFRQFVSHLLSYLGRSWGCPSSNILLSPIALTFAFIFTHAFHLAPTSVLIIVEILALFQGMEIT